jgi:hypothetical protein
MAHMSPAASGLERLTAGEIARHLRRGKRSCSGFTACCPAHEDRTPSLSLTDAPDGIVLVHCHTGCSQEAVIAALRARGLWRERERRVIVAEYDYTDADGKLLYQAIRTEPKGFFQRKPDGHGGWIQRGPRDEEKVLYRLAEIANAPIVFLVEGEKDAETLRAYGLIATTNVGGAKASWLPQYTEGLRGREVILIPDNDEAGWARAETIAVALVEAAQPLIVLDLPPAVKDITDWLLAGHSELELIGMVEAAHGCA